ncbi:MAG: hypothetical protein M3Z22_07640 [Verrucomicrobiota bacterium]|nr:hypothetical protein [Verrucomicrobiota bacterium]
MKLRILVCLSTFVFLRAVPAVAAANDSDSNTATSHKGKADAKSHFVFKDKNGKVSSVPVIEEYHTGRIVHPLAKVDPHLDKRMLRAASIAQERSHAHSKSRCWHYVKEALLASGAVSSRPKSVLAKEAGEELMRSYGFKRLPIKDPYLAPVGAVLVYGARRAPGHVEIRTKNGFVSDFRNKKPSRRPLIGVYAKV